MSVARGTRFLSQTLHRAVPREAAYAQDVDNVISTIIHTLRARLTCRVTENTQDNWKDSHELRTKRLFCNGKLVRFAIQIVGEDYVDLWGHNDKGFNEKLHNFDRKLPLLYGNSALTVEFVVHPLYGFLMPRPLVWSSANPAFKEKLQEHFGPPESVDVWTFARGKEIVEFLNLAEGKLASEHRTCIMLRTPCRTPYVGDDEMQRRLQMDKDVSNMFRVLRVTNMFRKVRLQRVPEIIVSVKELSEPLQTRLQKLARILTEQRSEQRSEQHNQQRPPILITSVSIRWLMRNGVVHVLSVGFPGVAWRKSITGAIGEVRGSLFANLHALDAKTLRLHPNTAPEASTLPWSETKPPASSGKPTVSLSVADAPPYLSFEFRKADQDGGFWSRPLMYKWTHTTYSEARTNTFPGETIEVRHALYGYKVRDEELKEFVDLIQGTSAPGRTG